MTRPPTRWDCWRWSPGQDVEPADGSDGTDGRWRIARTVAHDRVISTVDTQTRHTRKSKANRKDGFRGHLAVEPETGLITDCELTKAAGDNNTDAVVGEQMIARDRFHRPDTTTTDGRDPAAVADTDVDAGHRVGDRDAAQPDTTEQVATDERESAAPGTVGAVVDAVVAATVAAVAGTAEPQGLQVYGDSAYGTGTARAAYAEAGHDTMIKPKPLLPAVSGGFTLDDFAIDEHAGTVTCPGGHARAMSPKRNVTFGAACADCPLRARCTTATGGLSMSINEHEQLLRAARAQARTPNSGRPTRPGRW